MVLTAGGCVQFVTIGFVCSCESGLPSGAGLICVLRSRSIRLQAATPISNQYTFVQATPIRFVPRLQAAHQSASTAKMARSEAAAERAAAAATATASFNRGQAESQAERVRLQVIGRVVSGLFGLRATPGSCCVSILASQMLSAGCTLRNAPGEESLIARTHALRIQSYLEKRILI